MRHAHWLLQAAELRAVERNSLRRHVEIISSSLFFDNREVPAEILDFYFSNFPADGEDLISSLEPVKSVEVF